MPTTHRRHAGLAALVRQIDRVAAYLALHRWIMFVFSIVMVGHSSFWLGYLAATGAEVWRFVLQGVGAIAFGYLALVHHRQAIRLAITKERLRQQGLIDITH